MHNNPNIFNFTFQLAHKPMQSFNVLTELDKCPPPKYKLGDTVWFWGLKPVKATIMGLRIQTTFCPATRINTSYYAFDSYHYYVLFDNSGVHAVSESYLFNSEEEVSTFTQKLIQAS